MIQIPYKKVIAREWLLFLTATFIGINFSAIVFFNDSSEYIIHRKKLYESLIRIGNPLNRFDVKTAIPIDEDIPESQNLQSKHRKYDDIVDSKPLISYTDFSNILNDNSRRKLFYDSISAKYDLGEYGYFESRIAQPRFYSGYVKLFDHLFSRWFWLSTLFSLLLPYLIIQLIRSIYYSIRTLIKNSNAT
jgi:hypothetical protein